MIAQSTFADIIEINDRFHDSALLHHAVDIELFDFLETPRSAVDLASHYGWIASKGRTFLNSLVALGLIAKQAEFYLNTKEGSRLLRKGSDRSLAPVVMHQKIQWDNWAQIGENLRSEGPMGTQQNVRLAHDDTANKAYNAAMRNLSISNIEAFLKLGIARDRDFILDLAGGHGYYLAEIVKRHPGSRGEVWDLPLATPFARDSLLDPALAGRVDVRERDISEPGFLGDSKADLILLNNCLHYFRFETAKRIVAQCTRALNPGGRLVITAVRLDAEGTSPEAAAKFAFHMTMNAAEGGLHPTGNLERMLREQDLEPGKAPGGSLGIMDVDVIWGTRRA
jgi:SAM-dependent methyltransferase